MMGMIILALILSILVGVALAYAMYKSSIGIIEALALGLFFIISFVAVLAVVSKFLIGLTIGALWFFVVHILILVVVIVLSRQFFGKLREFLSWGNVNKEVSLRVSSLEVAFISFLFVMALAYVYFMFTYDTAFKAGGAVYQYLALVKLTESVLGLENYHLAADTYPYAYLYDPRLGPNFVFIAILKAIFGLGIETAAVVMGLLNFLLFYASLFSFVKELRDNKTAFIVCLILLFVVPPYVLFPIYSYFTFIDMLRAALFPQFFALGVMFIGLWAELRSENISNIKWNLLITKILVAFVLVTSHILTFAAFLIIDLLFILEDIIKSKNKKYAITNKLWISVIPIGVGVALSLLWPLNNSLYLLFLTIFSMSKPAGTMISEKEPLLARQKNFIGIILVSIYGLPFIIMKRRNIALTLWVISFVAISAPYLGPWEQNFPLHLFVLFRFMPLIRLPLTIGIADGLFMLFSFLERINIGRSRRARLKRYVVGAIPMLIILGLFVNISMQGYRTSYINYVLKKNNLIPKLKAILDPYDDEGGVLLALPYASYIAQAISNFSVLTVIKGQYGNPITAELYRNRTEALYDLFKSYDFMLWLGTILEFNVTHILLERVGPHQLILMALVDQLGCQVLYDGWFYKLLKVPHNLGIRNYIVNPSFEYGLAGWHYWGEGTVSISGISIDRNHSVLLEVEANSGLHIQTNRYYPILAGDNISISFYAKVVGNISSLHVGIGFSNRDKRVVGAVIQPLEVHNDTWWKYNITISVPAFLRGRMLFRVAIDAYAGEGGGSVYIDNVTCKTQTKLKLSDIVYIDHRMILDANIKKLFNRLITVHGDLILLGIILATIQIVVLAIETKTVELHLRMRSLKLVKKR